MAKIKFGERRLRRHRPYSGRRYIVQGSSRLIKAWRICCIIWIANLLIRRTLPRIAITADVGDKKKFLVWELLKKKCRLLMAFNEPWAQRLIRKEIQHIFQWCLCRESALLPGSFPSAIAGLSKRDFGLSWQQGKIFLLYRVEKLTIGLSHLTRCWRLKIWAVKPES